MFMDLNVEVQYVVTNLGIQKIYEVPKNGFTANTPLVQYCNKILTVSDFLSASGYLIDFIKANFDVSVRRYSEALLFLKSVNLLLNNQNQKKPTKACLHYAVDVIHEIKDRQAWCEDVKKANARIAFTLNAMIDFFVE
jgi:hypothetical protein